MENNYEFVNRCVPISNDDDDDDDGDDYHHTMGRNGVTSIRNEDYGGLLHELTSDQVDTSVAAFLSIMDSRSSSPQNVEYKDRCVATSEYDNQLSPNGTAPITPASMRSTVSDTTINESMDKVDKPIQNKKKSQDNSKQQQLQLHHKERELKCKRRICRIDGCQRSVKSQGVCQRHGARTKYCRVNACDKQAQGNFDGMCKAHYKASRRKQQLDLIIPPENVGHNPSDHYLENLIAETTDNCDNTLASVPPSHKELGRSTPNDNLSQSIAIITDYFSNKQNDLNYQHQPRQRPQQQQQQQHFGYPANNKPPAVCNPNGNSTVMPTSTSQFYSYQPTSYSNPSMPHQESSYTAPLAVPYCVPSNADPRFYYSNYNYQYNNSINHMVPPTATPQQYFQQQNGSHYVAYTNGGWSQYINPTETTSNSNITNGDPIIPTMVTSTAISGDSCAVISVLDATASSDPPYNDEITSSDHGHPNSSDSGMNRSYSFIPLHDGYYSGNDCDPECTP